MRVSGKACVIGAGSSGIAAAKALHERGIPYDCFEVSDRIGGNWVFGNRNGMSSAYRSLHINTSRDRMAYSDFPMPREYPDFPHHSLIARYFEQYVDHFGFRDTIAFRTRVEKVRREPDGRFRVSIRHLSTSGEAGELEERRYGAVLVANGHHWDPRYPEPPFPGEFAGEVMHSHYYVDNRPFVGKRVLVLGMGNSAMDIAVECSQVAARVYLSARRGAYIVPKYLFGRPLDSFFTSARIPVRIRMWLGGLVHRLYVGPMESYGLPRPDFEIEQAHPTISSDIFLRLGSGDVLPRPNIARLCGTQVEFEGGAREDVDVIIYCTGYKVSFPFFDPAFLSAPNNELPLFRRVFHPDIDNLFFIGLLQPLGAIMPLAEAQGRWVAKYLLREYELPEKSTLLREIETERAIVKARYVASPRHTMQVDYDDYLAELEKELRRGQKRVAAAAK